MPDFRWNDDLSRSPVRWGRTCCCLESFSGSEGVSRLFEYDVEVLAKVDTRVTAEAMIGRKVTLASRLSEQGDTRYLNGIVARFEERGGR